MSTTSTTKTKTNDADNARFNEIEGLVTAPENKARLQAAATAAEVRTIAGELGIDTSDGSRDMGKFIFKLKMIGVDLPAMAKAEAAARRAEAAQAGEALACRADGLPVVRLWSAAVESGEDAESTGAFAIVDAEGAAVWYGSFHPRFEKIRTPGDLVSAEQSAADKAVYAAYRARKAAGVDEVALWLTATCPDLDVASLRAAGGRLGVAVDVTVDDADLSAVEMAQMPGWRAIKDVSDAELARLVDTDRDADAGAGDEHADDAGTGE
ncbi:hypothetical protein CXF35_00635 [Corynebacterium bovis]|uniref:Uncharacterized protein n=1 Tax=Corynebacterium bovis TaxID=36808 RepID=A0A3R8PKR6_9CORY|nr:hypothetical protein [Corynebacterium bovis]RRO92671.1 hypothetical protein CXF40_03070 [Corynebacterium bovis]RRO98654.1 hypothetical protein CXF32_00470 [Corynebacterium bovis]RRO99696.1 hypothetical protein CXF41_09050 [Corynebacterium bovis]RRQ00553.1 hypothetical protein CXF31_00325 [Corynebacterium bovis]RRQ03517.1 hypothetical protein CXF42_06850 [Corynebacterium bovis]